MLVSHIYNSKMTAFGPKRAFTQKITIKNSVISIKTIGVLFLCLFIASCSTSSTSFNQTKYDSITGDSEKIIYVGYLNGKSLLKKDELVIEGAVELHEGVIASNKMGNVLTGTLVLFLYNHTGNTKSIHLSELGIDSTERLVDSFNTKIEKTLNLPAMSVNWNTCVKVEVLDIPVSQYETKLITGIKTKYKDEELLISFELNRLTSKELHKLIHKK